MEIKLSNHFTYGKLFQFVISAIVMMIFTPIYGVVDVFYIKSCRGNRICGDESDYDFFHFDKGNCCKKY